MKGILKAVVTAKRNAPLSKLVDAESHYRLARDLFGLQSAEARVAWCYWHMLRREIRGRMPPEAPSKA